MTSAECRPPSRRKRRRVGPPARLPQAAAAFKSSTKLRNVSVKPRAEIEPSDFPDEDEGTRPRWTGFPAKAHQKTTASVKRRPRSGFAADSEHGTRPADLAVGRRSTTLTPLASSSRRTRLAPRKGLFLNERLRRALGTNSGPADAADEPHEPSSRPGRHAHVLTGPSLSLGRQRRWGASTVPHWRPSRPNDMR